MKMVFTAMFVDHDRNSNDLAEAFCGPKVCSTEQEAVNFVYRYVINRLKNSDFYEVKESLIEEDEILSHLSFDELVEHYDKSLTDVKLNLIKEYFDFYLYDEEVISYFEIDKQPIKTFAEDIESAKLFYINAVATSEFTITSPDDDRNIALEINVNPYLNTKQYCYTFEDLYNAYFDETQSGWIVGSNRDLITVYS